MPLSPTAPASCPWFSALTTALDPRSAPRFLRLPLGAVLATGRRTVTRWLRAAGLTEEFRPADTTAAAAGKRADSLAARLAHGVLKPLLGSAERFVFALDDTPTPRYGPKAQGAGMHHNPTPGPAGAAFVYGHCWVVLAWLARHPDWGTLALPLLARLYVRAKDLPRVPQAQRPAFRTKLELAVESVRGAVTWLGFLGKPLWVVADGADAKAALLKPLRAAGVTVVSRLRKDAALCSLPGPRRPGPRGRQRLYGARRLDLAKRAGQRRGWQTGAFDLYGQAATTTYKTLLATWRPAGGVIRVVLAKERRGWVAFFATDPAASAADVLATIADRFSLGTAFRDSKQEVGAGQQQVRKLAAGGGCFHVCLGAYTLAEAWAWGKAVDDLVDRSDCPWDRAGRRPSHAEKRRAWRRALLGEEIRAALPAGASEAEIAAASKRLLKLVA